MELGRALLCPRLTAHAAHASLVPAVEGENVFGMLHLARTYGSNRLEDRCVEVIAEHLDSLWNSPELCEVLLEEVALTEQRGNVQVTDIPIAAEIRSVLRGPRCKLEREERETRLVLLDKALKATLGQIDAGCDVLEVDCM